MRVQALNGLTFQQKFRVRGMSISRPIDDKIVTTTVYKEYSNPNAERLHKLAKNEKDKYKKEQLLNQMGTYEIVEEDFVTDRILPEIREMFRKKR